MSSASRRETLENSRTRRPSGVAAVANFARYGDEVVRERVSIKWDGGDWYLGTVRQWSATSEEHLIAYDDGDLKWHKLGAEEDASMSLLRCT